VAAVATSSRPECHALAIMNLPATATTSIAVSSLYGGTITLFSNTLKKPASSSASSPRQPLGRHRSADPPQHKSDLAEMLANRP
jgi:O-acetylhomoserine (thiol)-lyase